MLKQNIIVLLIFILAKATLCNAHPVSWKNGIAIMPEYSKMRKELEINYSVTNSYAVGVSDINVNYKNRYANFVIPRFNYRLLRINKPDSQTNIYGSLGAGAVDYKNSQGLTGLLSFQADYETRRVYTLLAGETLQSTNQVDLNKVRIRLGVAPYLTEFEGLHTWLICQAEYTPELKNQWTITPLLRLFFNNYLIEVGSSTKGQIFVAGIFHF